MSYNYFNSGNKTHYFLFGEGPCVVFLHGYMEDHRVWDQVVKGIRGNTLLIPDLPGSSTGLIPENVDAIDFMADTVHGLIRSLGIEKYSVVGNSMGGYVAFRMMMRYSTNIDRVVLISTNPFSDTEKSERRRKREIKLLKAGKRDLIFNLFINSLGGRSRKLYELMSADIMSENMISHQKSMMNRPDSSSLFRSPLVPVHFMIGENDALIPVSKIKELLGKCPEVDFKTVKDATHFLIVENPDVATDFIVNSLNC